MSAFSDLKKAKAVRTDYRSVNNQSGENGIETTYNNARNEDSVAVFVEDEKCVDLEFVYEKELECPCCGEMIKTLVLKVGKQKIDSYDSDLRPVYSKVDAQKYDAILCYHCGYAALAKFFTKITTNQAKWIKEQITDSFKKQEHRFHYYTYEEAIKRHKAALMSLVVKRGKHSELAFCYLRIAWLCRGYQLELADSDAKKKYIMEEKKYIEHAYDAFLAAIAKETFPMCGTDEMTVYFIVSDLARQLRKYQDAKKMVQRIVLSKTANERVKDKARKLLDRIKQEESDVEA